VPTGGIVNEEEEIKTDHDLLIVINTKLKRVIDDVAILSNNIIGKIDKLECDKADKSEIKMLHGATLKRLDGLDVEVSSLAKWRSYVLGMIAIISFVVAFFLANWEKIVR